MEGMAAAAWMKWMAASRSTLKVWACCQHKEQ